VPLSLLSFYTQLSVISIYDFFDTAYCESKIEKLIQFHKLLSEPVKNEDRIIQYFMQHQNDINLQVKEFEQRATAEERIIYSDINSK